MHDTSPDIASHAGFTSDIVHADGAARQTRNAIQKQASFKRSWAKCYSVKDKFVSFAFGCVPEPRFNDQHGEMSL